jgi:hypothetical protein
MKRNRLALAEHVAAMNKCVQNFGWKISTNAYFRKGRIEYTYAANDKRPELILLFTEEQYHM